MRKKPANRIDETAAVWAARADRGLTPAEEQQLKQWLADDPRHLGAFARIQALATYLDRSAGLGPHYRPQSFRPVPQPWLARRRLLQGAVAAVGSVAMVGGAYWWMQTGTRYMTRRGEIKVVALSDGSVVTLNTDSSLRMHYARDRRTAQLEYGEALFEVAKDTARAFTVAAGDLHVRVVGTKFAVQQLAGRPTQVLVQEGVVEAGRLFSPRGVRLTADMRALLSGTTDVVALAVRPQEVARELVWLDGRISFEGETLATAAAEFARYSDTRIVIASPALAQEEVSGSFQANNPVGFGRAMAEALRAHIAVSDGEIRLYR